MVKALTVINAGSLLVSCDVTDAAADIKIFASTAGDGAAPIAMIDTAAPVWGVLYDAASDGLYGAQTNGDLAIFDDFLSNVGTGPIRTITPVDATGAKVSVNFQGVSVEGSTVVVSNVGDAASARDGALFAFVDERLVTGNLVGFRRISGPTTSLGNPVNVVLLSGNALAAKKSNNGLLVFNNVADRNGDIAPDYQVAFNKPESIEQVVIGTIAADSSDLDTPTSIGRISVALNPTPQQSTSNVEVGLINLLGADLVPVAGFYAGEVTGTVGALSYRTHRKCSV